MSFIAVDGTEEPGLDLPASHSTTHSKLHGLGNRQIYTPLNAQHKEIRLVTLHPGLLDAVIRCELKVHSLADRTVTNLGSTNGANKHPNSPKQAALIGLNSIYRTIEQLQAFLQPPAAPTPGFEALSYEWGTPLSNPSSSYAQEHIKPTILLQDHLFPVQPNLLSALNHLRSEHRQQIFWIDAICVNQSDTVEPSSQVALMGRIYTKAERVRIWLGPEAQHSGKAFQLLERISDISVEKEDIEEDVAPSIAANSPRTALGHRQASLPAQKPSFPITISGLSFKEPRPPAHPVGSIMASWLADPRELVSWRALCFLFHRSYWTSVWIVQEFVLAQTLTIHCGFDTIFWPVFSQAYAEIARFETARYPEIHYSAPAIILDTQSSMGAKITMMRGPIPKARTLLDLLKVCQNSGCCDRRDRVYALLGLASDVPDGAIVVDYKRPALKVREDVLQLYLNMDAGRDIINSLLLSMLENSSTSTTQEDLKQSFLSAKSFPDHPWSQDFHKNF